MRTRTGIIILALLTPFVACTDSQEPNRRPEFHSMTAQHTLRAYEVIRETVTASDPDNDPISIRIIDNPGFVSMEDFSQQGGLAAATLVIAPTAAHVGTYQMSVRAEDSHDDADTETCSIEVMPPAVDAVVVSPDAATLTVGETTQLTATSLDVRGNALAGRAITWSSSNAGVATVDPAGLVTAVAEGSATITATSEGESDSAAITVEPPPNEPPTATIDSPADGATYEEGQGISFSGSGSDPEQGALTGAALTWTSSLEGAIGTGESFSRSDLAVGDHTIVLTAEDDRGATGADTVSITVTPSQEPVPGEWQSGTEFGGFVLTVNSQSSHITEITYSITHWTCGSVTWYGNVTVVADPGWAITGDGEFTIENELHSDLTVTISGRFDATDHASGEWTADSEGTVCSGSWEGEPATRLFFRYDDSDGTRYLETDIGPADEYYWITTFSSGRTVDWTGQLEDDLAGDIYTAWLWLKADSGGTSGGRFHVSVVLNRGGSETEVASTTIDMGPTDNYRRFVETLEGTDAAMAGDDLIVRVTYDGAGQGKLAYEHEAFDSQVIVTGRVGVSMPSASALAAASARAGVIDRAVRREEGKDPEPGSVSRNAGGDE